MKSSIIVPVQDPTPFSPFSPKEDLEANLARISGAGYDGVELAITDPTHIKIAEIKKPLRRYNLAVSAITTGQAYGIEGLSLTSSDKDLRERAISRIKRHIELAEEFGAVVIIGLIRGEKGDREARTLLVESLGACARFDDEVELALEPLNRYEAELVNTVDEVLEVLDKIKMDNIGILLDTFHANIEEISIGQSIQRAGERLFHVHIADSNRWAPGYGHLDFNQISEVLSRIGYHRFGSLESFPKPNSKICLQESAVFIKNL